MTNASVSAAHEADIVVSVESERDDIPCFLLGN